MNCRCPRPIAKKKPAGLFIGLNGRLVFLVYADGKLFRYKTDDPQHAAVAEEVNLLPGGDARSRRYECCWET